MESIKLKEYEMLRKENMDYLAEKESVRKFVITSTVAVLTLSGNEMWKNDKLLFIIPMIVIILGMIKTISMEHRTKDIIGYRIVFLEDIENGFFWATASTKYDEDRKTDKIVFFFNEFDYFVLAMLCLGIYVSKFKTELFQNECNFNVGHGIGITILIFTLIILYLSFKRININSKKELHSIIDKWMKIKILNIDSVK